MAVENVDEKNTQSAWKVNSYVLETSGVLMFFVFVLRTPCSNIELGKMIYEHSEHKMRWEGKNSGSLSRSLLLLIPHHSMPLRNLRILKIRWLRKGP